MKTVIISALLALLFTACDKKPISIEQTNNTKFEIEKLFTHEGCTVFRFYDGGWTRYFTTCRGSVSWKNKCGRHCHNEIEVQTEVKQ